MPNDAERIAVEIAADATNLLSGIDESISRLTTFQGVALAAGAAAAGAFAVRAVGDAVDFAESMAQVSAKASLSAEEMADLHAGIDALRGTAEGARYSQESLAAALARTAAAGKSPAEMLKTLSQAARVATATKQPLNETVESLDDLLDATGRTAEGASHMADVLIVASTRMSGDTAENVAALSASLQGTAAQADAFGVSLETQAAIVTTLKDRGQDAAPVFAAMRALLTPSPDMAAGLDGIGVSLDDGTGKARPLLDLLADINARVASGAVTNDDASQAIVAAFGRSGAAVNALRVDLDKLHATTADLVSPASAASAVLDTMASTPQAQVGELRSKLDDVTLSLGEKLLPAATLALGALNSGLAFATEHSTAVGVLAGAIGAVTLALHAQAIAAGVSAIAMRALALAKLFAASASALLSFALSPIGLVVLAIAAAVALLVIAWQRDWGGIQAKTFAVVDDLKGLFDDVVEFLQPVIEVVKFVASLWVDQFSFIWSFTSRWVALVWDVVSGFLGLIVRGWVTQIGVVLDTTKAVFQTILAFVSAIFLSLRAIFTGDTEALKGIWSAFGARLAGIWSEWAASITRRVVGFIDGVKTYFTALPGKIVAGIGDLAGIVWNYLAGQFHKVAEKLVQWASGALGLSPTLTQIAAMIPKALVAGLANLGAGLWNGMVDGLRFVEGKFSEWVGGIMQSARNAWQAAQEILQRGWSAASGAVSSVAQSVAEVAIPVIQAATPAVSAASAPVQVVISPRAGFDDIVAARIERRHVGMGVGSGWMV